MQPIVDPDRLFINKWEMYKMFKVREKNIDFKLPETSVLSSENLKCMLEKYETLYVKPDSTWGGKKVSCIEKRDFFEWKVQGNPTRSFLSIEKLEQSLFSFYETDRCIIQQGAPLLLIENRPFDIRVHLQNDPDKGWRYVGDLVRVGGNGSIVSNVKISNGSILPTKQMLTIFDQKEENFFPKIKEISESICRTLDKYYSFEEAGVDFGLGEDGVLWLIEVNTDDRQGGPDAELFKKLPKQTYYKEILKGREIRNQQMIQWMMEAYEKYLEEKNTK